MSLSFCPCQLKNGAEKTPLDVGAGEVEACALYPVGVAVGVTTGLIGRVLANGVRTLAVLTVPLDEVELLPCRLLYLLIALEYADGIA